MSGLVPSLACEQILLRFARVRGWGRFFAPPPERPRQLAPRLAQGAEELFVTVVVVKFYGWYCGSSTVGSSKTSCDRVTNLVKYYPVLRKTAKGNDCGRITAAKGLIKEYFFFSALRSLFAKLSPFGRRSFPPREGGGTWVFFGWVSAARYSKLAPRSRKNFP